MNVWVPLYLSITGQIFDARSLAYIVLILLSYFIVVTDLKLYFLAAMNVHYSIITLVFSPLLPTELFLCHLIRSTM
jgi:hypothetical protein